MRVALLMDSLAGGGAERMMINLYKGLRQRNITCKLFTIRDKGIYKDIYKNIEYESIGYERTALSVGKIRKKVLSNKWSTVISTQAHINVGLCIASIGSSSSVTIALREANDPKVYHNDKSIFSRQVYKWAYKMADCYIGVSKGVSESIKEYYNVDKKRIHTVYNPVVDGSIEEMKGEEVSHEWFRGDKTVISSMGRIHKQKDYETLLKAFSEVRERKKAKLFIMGDVGDRVYYERIKRIADSKEIGRHVHFAGFVKNPFAVLSKSSLFVLSSRHEGLPGSLIQAMACGCPVVSTDCPSGPAEITRGGEIGRLVPTGNPKKLAESILLELEDPSPEEKLLSRAKRFSLDRSVSSYIDVIKKYDHKVR